MTSCANQSKLLTQGRVFRGSAGDTRNRSTGQVRPNHTDYQILAIIDYCGGICSSTDIVYATGKGLRYVDRRIALLVSPKWDSGNPWIERTIDGLEMTERGAQVFFGLRRAPYMVSQAAVDRWRDAVLWPNEARFSALENVALPSGRRAPVQDPERCAWRQNGRILPQQHEIDEAEMRRAWRKLTD